MTKIFISYSRTDEAFARRLATSLSDLGADIWIDVEDIPAGMKWSSAIQQGLDGAEALVVVISPESMASRNVEDEWQYFLDQNRPVIPIFLRPAKIHFQLNRIQWIDFKDQSFDVALQDLYHEFKRNGILIKRPPSPAVDVPAHSHGHAAPPAPVSQQQSALSVSGGGNNRNVMVMGGVIGGIIIIAIILMVILSRADTTGTQATLDAQTAQVINAIETQDTAATQTVAALPSQTPTIEPVFTGPVSNNDWQPVERDFDGVPMVLVPSGSFTFGATQEQFDRNYELCRSKLQSGACDALRDELNGEQITISEPFWIDRYEVSVETYNLAASSALPQVDVSSRQAQTHCTTRGGNLPTEAQWEYAAKGPEGWRYPWGETWDLSDVRSNICDSDCASSWRESRYTDGYAEAAPVTVIHGSESWVGARNMVGNVWEWTSDVYSADTTNVLRGGAWTWIQAESTTTSRSPGIANTTGFYGFRCMRPYMDGDLTP